MENTTLIIQRGQQFVKMYYMTDRERIVYSQTLIGMTYTLERKRTLWKYNWWDAISAIHEAMIPQDATSYTIHALLIALEQENISRNLQDCHF